MNRWLSEYMRNRVTSCSRQMFPETQRLAYLKWHNHNEATMNTSLSKTSNLYIFMAGKNYFWPVFSWQKVNFGSSYWYSSTHFFSNVNAKGFLEKPWSFVPQYVFLHFFECNVLHWLPVWFSNVKSNNCCVCVLKKSRKLLLSSLFFGCAITPSFQTGQTEIWWAACLISPPN